MTGALVKDWPVEKATVGLSGQGNHALWTLGHLATTYDWATTVLSSSKASLPPEWNTLFAYGTTPTADAKAYPAFAEVRDMYERMGERLMAIARSTPEVEYFVPLREQTGWLEHKVDAMFKLAWHDGWHSGQLSTLRRGLGMPGVM